MYSVKYRDDDVRGTMVDPTSDLGDDVDEADAPTCRTCDAPVVDESNHRVVTWVEDENVQTAHFCDDSCKDDWNRTIG